MCENFIDIATKDASLSLFILTKISHVYMCTCEVRLDPHHAQHVTQGVSLLTPLLGLRSESERDTTIISAFIGAPHYRDVIVSLEYTSKHYIANKTISLTTPKVYTSLLSDIFPDMI